MELPIYEVEFDEKDPKGGVYALSIVDKPAMGDVFLRLSETEPIEFKLEVADTKKRLLLGAALIPDKPIYRRQEGQEFYIKFRSDVIRKVAHEFIKRGNQGESFENHETKLKDVSVVETWIVENAEKDKSAHYGKQYPVGTWVTLVKVYGDETWKKAEDGDLNGFSIDGNFNLIEVKAKDENMSILSKIKALLEAEKNQVKPDKVKLKLGEMMTAEGVKIAFEGETLAVGQQVFALLDDGTPEPLPVGEYQLESGDILVVTETGMVGEIKQPEAPVEDMPAEMESQPSPAVEGFTKEDFMKMFDKALKARLSELKEELKVELMEVKEVKLQERPRKILKTDNNKPIELSKNKTDRMIQRLRQITK